MACTVGFVADGCELGDPLWFLARCSTGDRGEQAEVVRVLIEHGGNTYRHAAVFNEVVGLVYFPDAALRGLRLLDLLLFLFLLLFLLFQSLALCGGTESLECQLSSTTRQRRSRRENDGLPASLLHARND